MFKIITPPTVEPVTLTDVKQQLGIELDDNASDAVLTRRITQARQWVEDYCERALINQTIEFRFSVFPANGIINIPMPELVSVTSVKYIDTDGAEQTMTASDYVADLYDNHIRLAYSASWPNTRFEPNAVRVQYVAGYGVAATDVPENIIDKIGNIIGHWTNFQGAIESGINLTQIPSAVRKVLDN